MRPLGSAMRRISVCFALMWLFVLSCVGSTEPGLFPLGGTPDLHVPGTLIEMGCPDGWRYRGYGGPGGFIFFEPPQPLPGDIESFIDVFWGREEMFAGSRVPDAPDALLKM